MTIEKYNLYTLIAYKSNYECWHRNGDREFSDSEHHIFVSTDENEIAMKWAEFDSKELPKWQDKFEIHLLINGREHLDWPNVNSSDAIPDERQIYDDFYATKQRIEDKADELKVAVLKERQHQLELQQRQAMQLAEEKAKAAARAKEAAERARYEELKAKFGDS